MPCLVYLASERCLGVAGAFAAAAAVAVGAAAGLRGLHGLPPTTNTNVGARNRAQAFSHAASRKVDKHTSRCMLRAHVDGMRYSICTCPGGSLFMAGPKTNAQGFQSD